MLAGGDEGYADAAERMQEQHDSLTARLRGEASDHERRRGELSRLQAREASVAAQLGARAEGLTELEQRLHGLAEEIELLQIQIERDRSDLEVGEQAREIAAERVSELGQRRAAIDREKTELKQRVRASEQALDAARGELQKLRSRAQSLEEIQTRYRGCASGVQLIMQHREQLGVLGILADQLSAPARLEAALSSVLGDRLQGVLVAAPASGASGVALLKQKQEGRTAFLPREARLPLGVPEGTGPEGHVPENMPEGSGPAGVVGRLVDLIEVPGEYRPLARALLGETLVVETLAHALALWDAGASGPMVTLDGDRLEASGVVVGGSAKGLDAALLQQKREIRELHAQAETRAAELEVARQAHHALHERQSVPVDITLKRGHDARLHSDGQPQFDLLEGDRITISRAEHHVRLVHPPGYSYYAMLREKLHWSESLF